MRMGRRSKKDLPVAVIQLVLAKNLVMLRDRKYRNLSTETARNKKLATDAQTSLSQIQRILKAELAPGIDLLERLANALNEQPQDLITPYFAAKKHGVSVDRSDITGSDI